MTVRVKICGINSVEAANAAVAARADFGGLVFFPPSPRHLGFDQARHLAEVLRGRVQIVSLLVNPDDALLDQIVERNRAGSDSASRRRTACARCRRLRSFAGDL